MITQNLVCRSTLVCTDRSLTLTKPTSFIANFSCQLTFQRCYRSSFCRFFGCFFKKDKLKQWRHSGLTPKYRTTLQQRWCTTAKQIRERCFKNCRIFIIALKQRISWDTAPNRMAKGGHVEFFLPSPWITGNRYIYTNLEGRATVLHAPCCYHRFPCTLKPTKTLPTVVLPRCEN